MKRYLIAIVILLAALVVVFGIIACTPKTSVVVAPQAASSATILLTANNVTTAQTGTGVLVGDYLTGDCYATVGATTGNQSLGVTYAHSVDKANYVTGDSVTLAGSNVTVFTPTHLYGAWIRASVVPSSATAYTTTIRCMFK